MTENMERYEVCCYVCGSISDITMIEHRSKDSERIEGWLFVCIKCFPKLSGKKLVVEVEEKLEDNLDKFLEGAKMCGEFIKNSTESVGLVFGEICNRKGFKGIIDEYDREEACSCHVNPPCSSCTTNRGYCPECAWEA